MPEFSGAFASEERRKHSAPPAREGYDPDDDGDDPAELFPYDQGYEARVSCKERDTNPYHDPKARVAWFLGWDHAESINEPFSPPEAAAGDVGHAGSTYRAGNTLP